MSDAEPAGDGDEIEVTEWECFRCGWTEPEYDGGDPVCSTCEIAYAPPPETRVRTWPRCEETTKDGKRCGNRAIVPGAGCHVHTDILPDGGRVEPGEAGIHRETDMTWQDPHLGVKVEREVWRRNGEERRRLVVYGKRKDRHISFDGEKATRERFVKLGEFSETVATEVLFGLAEAHGYELEGE